MSGFELVGSRLPRVGVRESCGEFLELLLTAVRHDAGDNLLGGEYLDELLKLRQTGVGAVADPVAVNWFLAEMNTKPFL